MSLERAANLAAFLFSLPTRGGGVSIQSEGPVEFRKSTAVVLFYSPAVKLAAALAKQV